MTFAITLLKSWSLPPLYPNIWCLCFVKNLFLVAPRSLEIFSNLFIHQLSIFSQLIWRDFYYRFPILTLELVNHSLWGHRSVSPIVGPQFACIWLQGSKLLSFTGLWAVLIPEPWRLVLDSDTPGTNQRGDKYSWGFPCLREQAFEKRSTCS